MSKKKKIRVDFIKNRGKAPRENDFTRDFKTASEKIAIRKVETTELELVLEH